MWALAKSWLAFILYYSGLIGLLRLLGRNHAKILLYHSISPIESDFVRGTNVWVPCVFFARHLEYLVKHYKVVSLRELVACMKKGYIPARAVVLTFDDGFADNFDFAYPLLRRYKVPATIFVVADCVDKNKPIWVQELCYLLNQIGADRVIDALRMWKGKAGFKEFRIEKGISTTVHKQLEEYLAFCVEKRLREEILETIYRQHNISKDKVFAENRVFLRMSEVREMKCFGIDLGNHGGSHTPFSAMRCDEQEEEIRKAKEVIGSLSGGEFLAFAYPFGRANDFTGVTREIVERTGHNCILTTTCAVNDESSSLYELGRICVGNLRTYELAFELEKGVLKNLVRKWFMWGRKRSDA